ncbi:MAG: hypothetical protein HOQ26_19005 [Gemmatimonadaceae bacterium]|nr:hypothetical protein [Gemmatimonadaceae bacterium]
MTVPGDVVRSLKVFALACVALAFMGGIAAKCAADRQMDAQQSAAQRAQVDTLQARNRRRTVQAEAEHVAGNAARAQLAVVVTRAQRSDSLATAHRGSPALLAIDRALLPVPVVEQMRLDSTALADARLIAPAALVTIDHYDASAGLAIQASYDGQQASALAQRIDAQAIRSAHRRGVVQGIKGTVGTLALLVVVGTALHLGGKL